MKHFVITRNSYPTDYPHISNREDLMIDFVIPSIKKQTNKNFVWILTGVTDKLKKHLADVPYVESKNFKKFIKNSLKFGEPFLTTRLDNDDALKSDFIEKVQDASLDLEANTIIDVLGYRLDMRDGYVYKNHSYHSERPSPFLTLKEIHFDKEILSCYAQQHTKMADEFDVHFIDEYLYFQFIHETNKLMNQSSREDFSKKGVVVNKNAKKFIAEMLLVK